VNFRIILFEVFGVALGILSFAMGSGALIIAASIILGSALIADAIVCRPTTKDE
jgi:hypothetical protein